MARLGALRGALLAAQPAAKAAAAGGALALGVPLTLAAAGGGIALGLGYAANRAFHLMGGRQGAVKAHEIDLGIGKWNPRLPAFSSTFQASLLGGAGAIGTAQGIAQANPRWDVHQAIGTGAIEVERPHFLGATGSLTISSYNNRRRNRVQGNHPMWSQAAHYGHLADDVLFAFR